MKKILSFIMMFIVLWSIIFLVISGNVYADGTEILAPPLGITVASGSGIAAGGTGMVTQPGVITVDVPSGAIVKQVLLYWEGFSNGSVPGDDTISINGNSVTGVVIGGPTYLNTTNRTDTSFRSDITSLGLITPGLNTLIVDGMSFSNINDGVGVLVIFDNGSGTSDIQIRDGLDIAYHERSEPIKSTVPQTFNFAPAGVDRIAKVLLFVGGVDGSNQTPRPNSVEISITVGSVITTNTYSNVLSSNDGLEWDSLMLDVLIPNGATELKVQVFSRDDAIPASGNDPASLEWVAAIVSIPPAPLPYEADLSISKNDSPDPVILPGDPLTYTITATNNGPSLATGVVITDTLPASLTFLPSPQSSANCTEGPVDTITCTVGNLANGASSQVTIEVQTSVAEMVGNYASVTGNETDPDLSNNTVLQTTNVGDLSRLVNISTRGFVDTGDNVMIGGFFIGGSLTKRMYIRARGPSLSDFDIAGAMANPTLEIYFGPTLIAQNDDWQDTPQCSGGYTCYDAAAISATGLSPCSVTTTGCTLDSGILMDLPPGGYTAILKGVNGGTGVGIVEVFDPDTGSLPKIVNISTRGLVLTEDSVMIGGFWIGAGGGDKSVLIRARGPSLANFGVAGAMANPTLELYSGATKIAQNNDWQTTDALCDAPAVVCGTVQDIIDTGSDPCSVTTAGCTLDSAIHVTLPPGGYTAILKGVSNGTGVGIVEVFELGE